MLLGVVGMVGARALPLCWNGWSKTVVLLVTEFGHLIRRVSESFNLLESIETRPLFVVALFQSWISAAGTTYYYRELNG